MKKPVTDNVKKRLLDPGFYYEVCCMRGTFGFIKDSPRDIKNPNLLRPLNAFLIDFLVHVRILYEFFYTKKYSNALDYIKKWKVKKPLEKIHEWNTKINIYVAHLPYSRVTEWAGKHPYKFYPADRLYFHFRDLTIDFLTNLPKEYLTENLDNLLKELEKEIKNAE